MQRRDFFALAALPLAAPAMKPGSSGKWDVSWLDTLRGKHKQVFSVGDLKEHRPLHVVANWLDAHKEVFGLEPPQVNALVGTGGGGFPIYASDALWTKYELGRRWELKDPKSGEWRKHNFFMEPMKTLGPGEVSFPALLKRGTIFWQCNNALHGIAHMLAGELKLAPDAVYEELKAGLHPAVKVVPAHTFMLGLAQERGCAYEQVG